MADDREVLRNVAWQEVFPWLILFRTLRLALEFRKLLLAAAGSLFTMLGWWLCGWLLLSDNSPQGALAQFHVPRGVSASGQVLTSAFPQGLTDAAGGSSPLLAPWIELARPFYAFFDLSLAFPRGWAYMLASGLWGLAVWALFGGAISRMAAVQLAAEERLGLRQALRHARSKWKSYFAAPLMPLVGVFLFTLPLAVLGLLIRWGDLGLLAAGLAWPLVLLTALLITFLLVGVLFGWPLMWGALSVEALDSWDALSRAYSYVLHRPFHYLFYAFVATLVGMLGWLIVTIFAAGVLHVALWSVGLGAGNARVEAIGQAAPATTSGYGEQPFSLAGVPRYWPGEDAPLSAPGAWGAGLVGFWSAGVHVAVNGFVYSFFWTSATAIYLLLRRDEDATPLDEIHLESPEDPRGLPSLTTDAAGAPVAADTPPASAAEPAAPGGSAAPPPPGEGG